MTPEGGGRQNRIDAAEFPVDFTDFVRCLNARGVEYLLVGGYAVGVHGYVRATIDIDFLYHRTSENVGRLLMALEDFGAPPVVLDREHLESSDAVTAFGEPPMRIDLLSELSGVSYGEASHDAIEVRIGEDVVPVIGLTSLRVNKRASGRPRDQQDLAQLGEGTPPDTSSGKRPRRRKP